jgi:uncharacterized protein (TIGR03435 family)
MKSLLWTIVAAVSFASALQSSPQRSAFEVASIKPSDPANSRFVIGIQPGGRLVVNGATLQALIAYAYAVRNFQIIGGPNWMTTDRWDIEARAEEGTVAPLTGPPDPNRPSPVGIRLQSLLEDRFNLKLHRDTRELPIFELSQAKGGSKLKLSDDQTPLKPPEPGPGPRAPQAGAPMPRGSMSMMIGGGELEARAMAVTNLASSLAQIVGRTVIDKTELTGLYDFKLKWTPEVGQTIVGPAGPPPPGVLLPPVDPSGPSLVTALQDQLGLKLDSTKGPVQVLVIEAVQKPTEN